MNERYHEFFLNFINMSQIQGPASNPNFEVPFIVGATGGTGGIKTWQANIGGPWGNAQNPGNTTQRFLSFGNVETTAPSTSEASAVWVAPYPGTIVYVCIVYANGATITDNVTFSIRVNSTDKYSNIMSGGTSKLFGSSLYIPYIIGDYISIGIQQGGTVAATGLDIRASLSGYV